MPYATCRFTTDTATMAVFDPAALAHRSTDAADWWSDPDEELQDVNAGNVFFVGLGSDGAYACEIYRATPEITSPNPVVAHIRSIIGALYVGAGEQVPGDGIGPSTMHGGVLVPVCAGTVTVTIERLPAHLLRVWLTEASLPPGNSFQDSVQI